MLTTKEEWSFVVVRFDSIIEARVFARPTRSGYDYLLLILYRLICLTPDHNERITLPGLSHLPNCDDEGHELRGKSSRGT